MEKEEVEESYVSMLPTAENQLKAPNNKNSSFHLH